MFFFQSLMLAERACVYNMLLNLMETREAGKKHLIRTSSGSVRCSDGSLTCGWIVAPLSPELKGLGADFVFGFVQSMDGERDPRNLLLAFRVADNILQRGYELGESAGARGPSLGAVVHRSALLISVSGTFTEELFEVTSCYFPIDFTPVSPCLLS